MSNMMVKVDYRPLHWSYVEQDDMVLIGDQIKRVMYTGINGQGHATITVGTGDGVLDTFPADHFGETWNVVYL